ncbi:MAG: hypothetical protein Tsb0018_08120 [Opitutales bacterium]
MEEWLKEIPDLLKSDSTNEKMREHFSDFKKEFKASIEEKSKKYVPIEFYEDYYIKGITIVITTAPNTQKKKWIKDELRNLANEAIKTGDESKYLTVSYLPIRISNIALEHGVDEIFNDCLAIIPNIYSKACKSKDKLVCFLLTDRSWRWPFELAATLPYREPSKISKESTEKYLVAILETFQELLRKSCLLNKEDDFKQFLDKTLELNYVRCAKNDAQEQLHSKLVKHRNHMLFAFSSWLLHHYRDNKQEKHKENALNFYKIYLERIPQEGDTFEGLIDSYTSLANVGEKDDWNLTHWETQEKIDRGIDSFHVSTQQWMLSNYAIQAINCTTKGRAYLVKSDFSLEQEFLFCKKISGIEDFLASNEALLSDILDPTDVTKRIEAFKEFLNAKKKKFKHFIKEDKRTRSILDDQVEKFKNEVLETYKEKRGSLIQLLKKHNKYTTKDNGLKEGDKRFGITRYEPKEWFFGSYYGTYYHPGGSDIAEGLTLGEEKEIYRSLKEEIEKKLTLSWEGYKKAFELIDAEDIGDYVILIGYLDMYETLLKNSGAVWGAFPPPCEIYGEKVPVINPLCDSETQGTMILLNTKTLPTWVQYTNPKFENELGEVRENLYIDVHALSEDKAFDETLKSPPEWLERQGNEEAQKAYLEGLAIVKVYEKFNFDPKGSLEGSILVTFEGDP